MTNQNKQFLIIVALIVMAFIYTGINATKQNKQIKHDYATYIEIQSAIEIGKNLEKAIEKVDKLQKKYNDSYVFNIDKGFIYKELNQNKNAVEEFELAFSKNTSLGKNASLILVYGEVAKEIGDNDKVQKAIEQIKEVGVKESEQGRLNKLISIIKERSI